jgi:hypothetical protein
LIPCHGTRAAPSSHHGFVRCRPWGSGILHKGRGRYRSSGRMPYRSGPSSAITRRERRGAVDSELESAKLAVADFSWQKYQILCCIASSTNIRSTTLVATIIWNAVCATCTMRSREPCRNRRRSYSALHWRHAAVRSRPPHLRRKPIRAATRIRCWLHNRSAVSPECCRWLSASGRLRCSKRRCSGAAWAVPRECVLQK